MTENNILLTGQAREDYIATHFTSDTVIPETLMIETSVEGAYEKWYDGRGAMMQELIDEISDRTSCITEEIEYDEFIELLDDEGITTADDFMDRFECEFQYHRDLLDWVEELIDSSGYMENVPSFIANHIDYQAVWDCELRYDYSTIEYNGKTYLFRNS